MLERIGHFAHESSGIHRMHIAIIGTGISGMVAAALLHAQHQITVYEANNYVGGHTHTVDVELRVLRTQVEQDESLAMCIAKLVANSRSGRH